MPGKPLTASGKPRVSPRPFKAKPKPEGYERGRPTLYKPEYCDTVVSLMSEGYDVAACAGYLRVSRRSIYEWIDVHPEFSHAVEIGRGARLFAFQRKLLTTQIGVGVTAAIFGLKNADPDNWQDRYNTTSEVTVRVEKLTDQQIYAMLQAQGVTIEHDASPQLTHADERQPVASDEKPMKQGVSEG